MKTSLLSSPKRTALLRHVLDNPEERLSVRAIAKRLKLSPAFVSIFLKKLKKEGFADGKVNLANPKVRALKLFFNMDRLIEAGFAKKIKEFIPSAAGAGVYGSWACGLNNANSDLDIWVLAEKADAKSALRLRMSLKRALSVEPNILVLSARRLAELKEKDSVFYQSLRNSIVLWGEGID